jgi:hypothetical protein
MRHTFAAYGNMQVWILSFSSDVETADLIDVTARSFTMTVGLSVGVGKMCGDQSDMRTLRREGGFGKMPMGIPS